MGLRSSLRSDLRPVPLLVGFLIFLRSQERPFHQGYLWLTLTFLLCRLTDNSALRQQAHKAVKFGDPFDSRTSKVGSEQRNERLRVRRSKAELESLRSEERTWSFWGAILRRFGRG
jgi:hypothetical protein